MTSFYQDRIRETVAKMGRIGIDPRHVEGWMRLEYSTLDALGGARWTRAVREAIDCIDASTPLTNDRLAASYGLMPRPEPTGPVCPDCLQIDGGYLPPRPVRA